MATIPSLANYNINPQPQFGSGSAYGAVPGAIGLPPSTYSQVGGVLPNLNQLTGQTGEIIGSELAGQLPSGTIGSFQDAAAAFGVSSGMPGSGLQKNMGLESLGLSALQMQQTGLKDYQSILSSLGSTQLDPSLISNIAAQNAMYAAAPDPSAAADILTKLAGGGGGGMTLGGGGGAKTTPVAGTPAGQIAAQGYTPYLSGGSAGSTGTLSGGSSYGNDQWYYAGQVGPGVDPTNGVGLPGFGAGTTSGGDSGSDQDYYDFLIGGGGTQ